MLVDTRQEEKVMTAYTPAALKAELHERGWRMTPQRETMLKTFQNLPEGTHLSAEDQKLYEINRPAPHHHHHLICVRCNKTIEFKNDSVLKVGAKTAEKSGYQLLDCQLSIHAVCPACQRSILPKIG
jgi:Fur family transcriptional regulator, ferric uptake regulator